VEEGSLSRTLAFDCGHGYAQEEYAVKRERVVYPIGVPNASEVGKQYKIGI